MSEHKLQVKDADIMHHSGLPFLGLVPYQSFTGCVMGGDERKKCDITIKRLCVMMHASDEFLVENKISRASLEAAFPSSATRWVDFHASAMVGRRSLLEIVDMFLEWKFPANGDKTKFTNNALKPIHWKWAYTNTKRMSAYSNIARLSAKDMRALDYIFRVDVYGRVISVFAKNTAMGGFDRDHLFPKRRGGESVPDNLVAVQYRMNRSKRETLLQAKSNVELFFIKGLSVGEFLSSFHSKLMFYGDNPIVRLLGYDLRSVVTGEKKLPFSSSERERFIAIENVDETSAFDYILLLTRHWETDTKSILKPEPILKLEPILKPEPLTPKADIKTTFIHESLKHTYTNTNIVEYVEIVDAQPQSKAYEARAASGMCVIL